MDEQLTRQGRSMLDTATAVITNPGGFFRSMPKSGGLADPIVFLAAIGVVTALVNVVLSLFMPHQSVGGALLMVVLAPIIMVVFGFVVAGILYFIWKLMGSSESYETAYRCMAYAAAITPILAVIGMLPYLGTLISVAWWTLLLILASVGVHGLRQQAAAVVFGVIGAVLVLFGLSAEYAARQVASDVARWGAEIEREFGDAEERLEAMQRALEASGLTREDD